MSEKNRIGGPKTADRACPPELAAPELASTRQDDTRLACHADGAMRMIEHSRSWQPGQP